MNLRTALFLSVAGTMLAIEPTPGLGGGGEAAGHAAPAAHATTPGVPNADQALAMLREGNMRFVSGKVQRPNSDAARRAETASGQAPFAIVLSCADSRVPVELAFDRGVGDVFVIRVAGNVADTDEIGTIEYGVGHLHSPLVVVMGHSSCGAVNAVASGAEVHGSIPGLVDNIIPAVEWVKANRPELTGDALVTAAIEANVWQSIDDLLSESQEVRTAVESSGVKVVGAVYDLATGRVRFMGEHPYQAKIIQAARSMNSGGDHKAGDMNDAAPAALDEQDQPPQNVPEPSHAMPKGADQAKDTKTGSKAMNHDDHAAKAPGKADDTAKAKPKAKDSHATGHDDDHGDDHPH
jgi:carbonic anhydrase